MEETLSGYRPQDAGSAPLGPGARGNAVTRIFFILFCLEIGLVLILLPWTQLWDNNYFFSLTPDWSAFWFSTYLRGATSGVGLVNIWIALTEAWRMWH